MWLSLWQVCMFGPVNNLRRVTKTTLDVLVILVRDAATGGEVYGQAVARELNKQQATAYDVLGRLEEKGWVTSRREDGNPVPHLPPRKFYSLTAMGREKAAALLAQDRTQFGRRQPRRRPSDVTDDRAA